MTLKALHDDLSEIPEAFRNLYSERDGHFELTGIDGVRTQADVDRLHDGLRKERAEHKATKEQLKELNKRFVDQENSSKEYRASGSEIDSIGTELMQAQQRIQDLTDRLQRDRVRDVVRRSALEMNVMPVALDDVLLLADQTFEMAESGEILTSGGGDNEAGVSPDDWLDAMKERRPHWWPSSVGAGASNGSAVNRVVNPWAKENWNLTEQGRLLRSHPDRARRLAAAVGVQIGG